MPLTASQLIEVKRTKQKGRGVYARKFIPEGTVFERVPLLVVPAREIVDDEHGSVLSAYIFEYPKVDGMVALALGFGSLYNHSFDPNARSSEPSSKKRATQIVRSHSPDITIFPSG